MFVKDGRWRGNMPFRQARPVKELLDQLRRTGEPSLASLMDAFSEIRGKGHGEAQGSFTEGMREALLCWVKKSCGSSVGPITFEYRLSRHRRINVIGRYPYLQHNPMYGRGYRGFVLILSVDSIDGLPLYGTGKRIHFAWNRIVGRDKLLLLTEGARELQLQEAER